MLQEQDPIFSNDLPGVIKLALSLGALGLSIIAALWKIVRGPMETRITENAKGLADEIAAREKAVAESKADREKLDARATVLERDYIMLSANLRGIDAMGGRLEEQNRHIVSEMAKLVELSSASQLKIVERLAGIEGQLRERSRRYNDPPEDR